MSWRSRNRAWRHVRRVSFVTGTGNPNSCPIWWSRCVLCLLFCCLSVRRTVVWVTWSSLMLSLFSCFPVSRCHCFLVFLPVVVRTSGDVSDDFVRLIFLHVIREASILAGEFTWDYYEQQMKWELQGLHICGCRCKEILKAKLMDLSDSHTVGCTRKGGRLL